MPVLACLFEAAGMSTVLVTNMPYWAEKVGAPRTLAVEFPFGHTLGQAHNQRQQLRVIEQALAVLEAATAPGFVRHSAERWPTSHEEALASCHPPQPPPIMGQMGRHIGSFLRAIRRGRD